MPPGSPKPLAPKAGVPPPCFQGSPLPSGLGGDLTWDRCSGAGSVSDAGQRVSSRPGDGWEAAHLSLGFGPEGAAPDTCLCCNWLSQPVGGASVPWSSGTLGHVMAAPCLSQGRLCLPQWTRGSQARGLGKVLWTGPAPPWGTSHFLAGIYVLAGGSRKEAHREPEVRFQPHPAYPLVLESLVKISPRAENRII